MKLTITTNEGNPVGEVSEDYDVTFSDERVPEDDRERIRGWVRTMTKGDVSTTPDAEEGKSVTPPERKERYPPEIGLKRVLAALPRAGPYLGEITGDVEKQAETGDSGQTLEIRDYYRVWVREKEDAPDEVNLVHDADGPAGNEFYYEVPFETTTTVDIGKQDPAAWTPEKRDPAPDYDDLVACSVPDPDLQLVKQIDADTTAHEGLYRNVESPLTLLHLFKRFHDEGAGRHQAIIKRELDSRGIETIERVAKARRDE